LIKRTEAGPPTGRELLDVIRIDRATPTMILAAASMSGVEVDLLASAGSI
jgi:hypothetical protein